MEERSVVERLFDDGDYENLLVDIFAFLDGPSLEACAVVNKRWRQIVRSKAALGKTASTNFWRMTFDGTIGFICICIL
jgi:hypothetical protein